MTDKKQQIADRIQRRMLRETRQRLKEAQEALKASETQNEKLIAAIRLEKKAMHEQLTIACETINRKDALITILKQRVENLGEEYHNKVFTRRVTTLDDVHKITREIES